METRRLEGGVFLHNFEFSQYSTKNIAQRICRKFSREIFVLTLSYDNTALSQSAFRIYKCYIIISCWGFRSGVKL